MNLKKMTFILALSVLSTNAFAGFLKDGGYLGSHNGKNKVNLLVKPAPGRGGYFLPFL